MPRMTHFGPKKCTVSLWEGQFATLYLFRAYTGLPQKVNPPGQELVKKRFRGVGVKEVQKYVLNAYPEKRALFFIRTDLALQERILKIRYFQLIFAYF